MRNDDTASSGFCPFTRRGFLAAGLALASCQPRRSTRRWTGGIVGASHQAGHVLREASMSFAAPASTEKADVIVVGGGMSGLIAAWRLQQAGRRPLVLELEPHLGGNSASGTASGMAHPWGAHYVPVPSAEMEDVCAVLGELGLGRPGAWREDMLCHDPHERLWMRGQWQEGLVPEYGISADDRVQIQRFAAQMADFKNSRGADGRRAFCLPVAHCSHDAAFTALDEITMSAWLDAHGFTSEELLWHVDYCCRDDYGAGIAHVSAWAGIHYFASRPDGDVFTWPEGNGWIVQRLRERLAIPPRSGHLVVRATPEGEVTALDVAARQLHRWQAEAIVWAAPRFVARRVAEHLPAVEPFDYSPWMVATLTTRQPLSAVWDNVLRRSRSLGYIMADHQRQAFPSLSPAPAVATYYLPLDGAPPPQAREHALALGYDDWCEMILDDLRGPHPDLAENLLHLDVWLWGHGMVRPTPGVMFDGRRALLQRDHGRITFAHTDLSGLSLFEEACHWGNVAARRILSQA